MVSTPTSMLRHYVKSSGFSAFTPHKPPQEQVESHRSNPQKKTLVLTKAEKLHTPQKKKYVGYVYCYTHSPQQSGPPSKLHVGPQIQAQIQLQRCRNPCLRKAPNPNIDPKGFPERCLPTSLPEEVRLPIFLKLLR